MLCFNVRGLNGLIVSDQLGNNHDLPVYQINTLGDVGDNIIMYVNTE